jgi:hypothetical protein
MVSFIKSKGTSVINKPVGISRVDTGAIQAGEALARTGQTLANTYFAEATRNEQKKGRDYVAKLPVRDIDGNLEFKSISGLSEVATQTAEPLLRKKYGEALAVDMQQNIQQIRLKYEGKMNPSGFQDEAKRFIGTYIDTVKEQGGGQYTSLIQDGASKYIVQNFNDLTLDKINTERKISLTNSMAIINESINDISSQMTNVPTNINDQDFKDDLDFAETSIELIKADIQDKIPEGLSSSAALNTTQRANDAIATGLMSNILRGKSAQEMYAIQNQYNLGTQNNVSSEKTKDYINLIKEKFGDNQAVSQIIARSVGDQNGVESKETTLRNAKTKETNRVYTDIKKSSESLKAGEKFQNDIENKASNIEPTADNLRKLFDEIDNTKDTGVVKNIPNYGPVLSTQDEINRMKARVIDKVITSSLEKSNIEITSKEYSNIKTKIAFPNKEITLSENSKKFLEVYNKLNENFDNVNFKDATLASISNKLKILKENNTQNKTTQATSLHNSKIASGTYVHTDKGSQIINANLGLADNYFLDGGHNKNSENFETIENSINAGQIPSSLISGFKKVLDGTANEFQIQTMLGLYKRYSQQVRNGVMVSGLGNVLTRTESALFESISELYQQAVGLPEFAGIKGINGQVTLNQIITKVKSAYQEPLNEYVAKVKLLDSSASNERDILRTKLKFNPMEVNFFDSYAKLLISNGESLETVKTKVKSYRDQYFVDTEGQVVDPMYSSNTTKSIYSLLRVIPNEADRERFITHVNGTLPSSYVLYDSSFRPDTTNVTSLKNINITQEISRKYAGQTFATFNDIPQDLKPSIYKAARQGLFDVNPVDKFAVLVPIEYGAVSLAQSGDYISPTANLRYQAYEVKNNELVPIENEQGPVFYDVDNVLDQERPIE